tara:strand:+ start:942 stop:1313 length:372 start_codon:yes stop_codon:yes gene_type:complete
MSSSSLSSSKGICNFLGNKNYVYVLRLENDKYYVGITDCLEKRLYRHIRGYGSKWTSVNKYVEVVKCYKTLNATFDEKYYTLLYMYLHGIENVRGWRWCKICLNKIDLQYINFYLQKYFLPRY